MKRIKHILISIVMIGLAAYGGLKLMMWQKARSDIDTVFNAITYVMTAAYGTSVQANYERISTSVFGPVGIRGVTLRFPAMQDEIRVGEFKLLERDLDINLQKGGIPLRLHFVIDDLRVSTALLDKLSASLAKLEKQHNAGKRDSASILSRLGYASLIKRSEDLRALGYSEINMDMEYDMLIDPVSKEASLNYRQDIDQLGELTARVKLLDMTQNIDSAVLGVRIKDATIKFVDDSYINRLIGLYAKDQQQTLDVYRKQLLPLVAQDMNSKKIKLSPESVKNLQTFLSDPKQLILTVYPFRPVGIESIKHYKPGDVPMLLNLQAHLE